MQTFAVIAVRVFVIANYLISKNQRFFFIISSLVSGLTSLLFKSQILNSGNTAKSDRPQWNQYLNKHLSASLGNLKASSPRDLERSGTSKGESQVHGPKPPDSRQP